METELDGTGTDGKRYWMEVEPVRKGTGWNWNRMETELDGTGTNGKRNWMETELAAG